MTDTTSPQTARYRHRTSEVEAVQWTGSNADQLRAFCGPDFDEIELDDRSEDPDQTAAVREADHGTWRGLAPGDWVVRLDGGLYEFSAADFAKQYEPAAPSAPAVPPGCWYNAEAAEKVMWAESMTATSASPPAPADRSGLRERIAEALCTTRRTDYEGAANHRQHRYDARCALCAGDVDALTEALLSVLPPAADRAAVCICGHCEVVATEAQQQPGGTAFSPGEGVHGRDPYYASSDTEAQQQAETQAPDADPVYDPRAWETYRRDAGCGCTAPAPVHCKIPHGTGVWLCTCHRLAGPPLRDGDPRGTFLTSEEEAIRRHFQEPNRCLSTDGIFRCSRPTGHLGDHRTGRTFWGRRAEDTTPPAVVAEPGKENSRG